MKVPKLNAVQTIVAVLSCPILGTIFYQIWKISADICVLLIVFFLILAVYLKYPWRYKDWKESTLSDEDEKKKVEYLKSTLKFVHNLSRFSLVAVIMLCGIMLIVQVIGPSYVDEKAYNLASQNSFGNISDSVLATGFTIQDSVKLRPHSAYIAVFPGTKGIAYSSAPFLSNLFHSIYAPLLGIFWSACAIVLLFLVGAFFCELIASIFFKFK